MKKNYPWGHNKPYNDYSSFFKRKFKQRIQKISIDAGFTCPNRDGTKGRGGCLYCYNKSFNPFYCSPEKSITGQLNEGIAFFQPKYKTQKYLAYFQAYTNTYGTFQELCPMYEEALHHPKVIGLVIATRPDCISAQLLDYLNKKGKKAYIVLEYGVETYKNQTLDKINRNHTFEEAVDALKLTALRKHIRSGIHLILGLPGETKADYITMANKISKLPVETIKLHQLQVLRETKMAQLFENQPELFEIYTVEQYIDIVVNFLAHLNPAMIVERFISESPPELIISPKWNRIKNFEFVSKVEKELHNRNWYQGMFYQKCDS